MHIVYASYDGMQRNTDGFDLMGVHSRMAAIFTFASLATAVDFQKKVLSSSSSSSTSKGFPPKNYRFPLSLSLSLSFLSFFNEEQQAKGRRKRERERERWRSSVDLGANCVLFYSDGVRESSSVRA